MTDSMDPQCLRYFKAYHSMIVFSDISEKDLKVNADKNRQPLIMYCSSSTKKQK